MELAQFSVTRKTVDFRGMEVGYNADAFTPAFLRKAAGSLRQSYKPIYEALPDIAPEISAPQSRKHKALAEVEDSARNLEEKADILEAHRKVYASLLAGTPDYPVLMDWQLTRDGTPIPISEDELNAIQNPQIVIDLWDAIKGAADPKSPEIPATQTSRMISETSKSRSSSPETPQDDGQIM